MLRLPICLPTVTNLRTALSDHPQVRYVGAVYSTVDDAGIEDTLQCLESLARAVSVFLNVVTVTDPNNIISLLDAGVSVVIVSEDQFKSLTSNGIVTDRLAVAKWSTFFDSEPYGASVLKLFDNVRSLNAFEHEIDGQPKTEINEQPKTHEEPGRKLLSLTDISQLNLEKSIGLGFTPLVPASSITSGAISLGSLYLVNAKSDRPDGLFPTIVLDERGISLGLVYSNAESLKASLQNGRGVYMSRKRGLWFKGDSTGDTQLLKRVAWDCDSDCLCFTVQQLGKGFCHLGTTTCFGDYSGLSRLQNIIQSRKDNAPPESYTARLFNDPTLVNAKITEEAQELCEAESQEEVAFEAADLLYFTLTKCIAAGVTLEDIERNLDAKHLKVVRRKGDAKPPKPAANTSAATTEATPPENNSNGPFLVPRMKRYIAANESLETITAALQRPSQRSSDKIMSIVQPIIKDVSTRGDAALLEYTHKFERATSLTSPILRAPFAAELMQLSPETQSAMDISFANIEKFHAAQRDATGEQTLRVTTMPGVECSRVVRPIERVGLYVPGGTAVLPSTALMLGVPARVAGCTGIVFATPPRADGSVSPEIVYAAHRCGAQAIVLAGGAQAVAALAYGTQSVPKCDKILGPGNQFVTAAKMLVANDTNAHVAIDMPAGPSEILVVADASAPAAFVAADLLSQAEHGVDSQVVLIAAGLGEEQLLAIEARIEEQARLLPRRDIVAQVLAHSVIIVVKDVHEALRYTNLYAPEHLSLLVVEAEEAMDLVQNAGSVFVGMWAPESVGDYSAGVNHALPTYGYARQYSGVNWGSYVKHITSSKLTKEGLQNVGGAVMQMAKVEGLEAHRRAVAIRLEHKGVL